MQFKYYAAALFSFIVWGMFSLVLRPLSAYASLDILLYRILFATGAILLISFLFRPKVTKENIKIIRALSHRERRSVFLHVFCSAVMLSLNWFLFIYVMNNVSVNATSLAYLICPIITTVLASVFLKEQLNRGQWLAVGLSVLACLMLAYGNFMDMIYSVVIAFTYATYLVLQKRNNRLDKFFTLNLHIIVTSILLTPMLYILPEGVTYGMDFYGYVLLIALLFTIIPLFLNMYALKGLDSSVVGILLYINPTIAFLLAVFYFKEEINLVQIMAYGLIFLAVIIFNVAYLRQYHRSRKQEILAAG
ncbi:EamA family transporter [Sphingobacterium luzhongxinii]|uniref:EamA family transporter n=1 Tax=Sphingobacterium luzhongxinii TaxID=2654181 RepID=UPI001969B761|nr:EamA family transporter [Sphingobacterium sp. xlx-73]